MSLRETVVPTSYYCIFTIEIGRYHESNKMCGYNNSLRAVSVQKPALHLSLAIFARRFLPMVHFVFI